MQEDFMVMRRATYAVRLKLLKLLFSLMFYVVYQHLWLARSPKPNLVI
jgi:hypothetical protein